jgi:Ca2+-binding EF-hand superfamily protein
MTPRLHHPIVLLLAGLHSLSSLALAQAPVGGVFQRFDRNADGEVTPEELPDVTTFARFDLNKDGAITKAEYNQVAGIAPSPPSAPPGPGAKKAAQPSPLEWFNTTDRNQDGKLSREESPSPRFKELDTDGDGFVTLAEYWAFLNRAALKQLDKDGDDKISQLEFNALYQNAEHFFNQRRQGAQPVDGRKLPDPLPVKADPLGLRFTQDYFPGTKDPDGRLMAATEANQLVAHRGMVFASFGATYRRPPTPDPDFVGHAILRKETADGPWCVDFDFGPRPYRVEVMTAVSFTTDGAGRELPQPVPRLVAARWSPNKTILVRDDEAGKWLESTVLEGPPLPPGAVFTARSFGSHVDRVTGVQGLFAGVWQGHGGAVGEYRSSVYRAVFDGKAPGGLRWSPEPELTGVGRIMAFAECNGDLYASCCIFDDTPLSGGIFRRVDGPEPRWGQVYRWKEYNLQVWDDEQRMMRGLTAVPDLKTPGKQVLIGFRFFPEPMIERIDPQQGHKAPVELQLNDFFGQAFFGGDRYLGTIRAAYNPFTPFTDPRTGQTVHLCGVQIYHPGFPNQPHNGSHYLLRRADATYDWAPIFDPAHPVPVGRSLDATRRILVSPFAEDQGRVVYFAGYDGPFADNRSAWIYKAEMR